MSASVFQLDAALELPPQACVLALQTLNAALKILALHLKALVNACRRVPALELPTQAIVQDHLTCNVALEALLFVIRIAALH